MSYAAQTPAQLGQILQAQRKASGLNQQQAAASVGLLPKTISRLERAPDTATIDSLFKLLSALQLELVVRSKDARPTAREW